MNEGHLSIILARLIGFPYFANILGMTEFRGVRHAQKDFFSFFTDIVGRS